MLHPPLLVACLSVYGFAKTVCSAEEKIAHNLRTSISLLGETFGEVQKGACKILSFWDRHENL
jgi:hypothetical protein